MIQQNMDQMANQKVIKEKRDKALEAQMSLIKKKEKQVKMNQLLRHSTTLLTDQSFNENFEIPLYL